MRSCHHPSISLASQLDHIFNKQKCVCTTAIEMLHFIGLLSSIMATKKPRRDRCDSEKCFFERRKQWKKSVAMKTTLKQHCCDKQQTWKQQSSKSAGFDKNNIEVDSIKWKHGQSFQGLSKLKPAWCATPFLVELCFLTLKTAAHNSHFQNLVLYLVLH